MKLLLVRHGPTDWNDAGRIQGHSDVPLSARAGDVLGVRQVPQESLDWRWYVSPLQRARQTARLLGVVEPSPDARLREMAWGEWEGCTRADIAQRYGRAEVDRLTSRGMDFRPPAGESPREVCARLGEWLDELWQAPQDSGAVTHKGVIRAMLALATGWDLSGGAPVKMDWSRAQLFALEACEGGGWQLRLQQANLAMVRRDGGDPQEAVEGW